MRQNNQYPHILLRNAHHLLFLVALALLAAVPAAGAAHAAPELPDTLRVVRIRAATPAEARQLVSQGVDLLEARDGADLFAIVTPDEQTTLAAAGWDVRLDMEQTALLQRATLQGYDEQYQTVEEIEQFLQDMAARYPHLAVLEDIGDSWERQQSNGSAGYDLWAIRLTNQETAAPKPVFVLMAAIHARELTTAEIALRFIEHLLSGYGSEAEATWLLDEHEIVVLPMVNPDGHKLAEQGYMQRKNTNNSYGGDCPATPFTSSHFGVDLNRNFAYQWGTVDGPDLHPCSQTFPGDEAASEPETQALQQFIRSLYPNQARPTDGSPMPDDTSGVLITLHSYGDLVLWPWGHSNSLPPDSLALQRLGERMARFNDYEPAQSVGLYPTSGTTDDWSYGTLGLASYTFEIGPLYGSCGGFMPPYSCLNGGVGGEFWPRNLPALLYAARVSSAPYRLPAGPDLAVESIDVVSATNTLTVTMTLSDSSPPVTAVELSIGASPERAGTPIALQSTNGLSWTAVLSPALLLSVCADGQQRNAYSCLASAEGPPLPLLLVRGRSSEDDGWGPMQAAWPEFSDLPNEPLVAMPEQRLWLPLVSAPSPAPGTE